MHHGWKHWCNEDAKLCAEYATEGYIPGIIFNATTSRELLNYALNDVDANDSNLISPNSDYLVGTWKLVNESNVAMGNMSMDNMNNMIGTSGKLVINKAHDYNETISGQTIPGRIQYLVKTYVPTEQRQFPD